jgi:hypothetical protein
MLFGPGVSIVDLTVAPLSIPLREPFVIASGQMDAGGRPGPARHRPRRERRAAARHA